MNTIQAHYIHHVSIVMSHTTSVAWLDILLPTNWKCSEQHEYFRLSE